MFFFLLSASLLAQGVNNLPVTQEPQVQSLGWEDLLEKEMATHFSILTWRTPWTEEPSGQQSTGCKISDTIEQLTLSLFTLKIYILICHVLLSISVYMFRLVFFYT